MFSTAIAALVLAAAGALAVGACGEQSARMGGAGSGQGDGGGTAALTTADTPVGEVVTDGERATVYVFDRDTRGADTSACTGSCLQAWPPVTVDSRRPRTEGVTGDVGTIRADGAWQVTLNGLPLYTYAGDQRPGEVNGQAVEDVWWVVAPDGTKITEEPPAGDDGDGGYGRDY